MVTIIDVTVSDDGVLTAVPKPGRTMPHVIGVFLNGQVAATVMPKSGRNKNKLSFSLPTHMVAAEVDLFDAATCTSLLPQPLNLDSWYNLQIRQLSVERAFVSSTFEVRGGLDLHLGFELLGMSGAVARGIATAGKRENGRCTYSLHAPLLRLLRREEVLTVYPRVGGHIVTSSRFRLSGEAIGLIGHLDEVHQGKISGWAADLADTNRPLTLDVSIDGETVTSVATHLLRDDLRHLGLGDSRCGFDLALDSLIAREKPTQIAVSLAGSPTQLAGSPITMTYKRLLSGSFDTFHGMSAYGWALDRENPDVSVSVEAVDLSGKVLATTEAKLFRGDLLDAGLARGLCAFKLDLSRHFKSLLGSEISVRIVGSLDPLVGSPRLVTANPNLLSFLERGRSMSLPVLSRLQRRLTHSAVGYGISIIMPVYNTSASHLSEAIDSVSHQWCSTWELICVDDASTQPHVRQLLAAYAVRDTRIRILVAPENGGIAKATNFGLRAARYDHAAFMDHDDALEPDAIWQLIKAIRRSNADLLYSDEAITDESLDGITEIRGRPAFSHDYYLSHPYFVHLICVRTLLAREVGGWDETMAISADVDFVLRLLEHAQVVAHVPYVLYRWRTHAASTGHRKQAQVMEATRAALQRHLNRLNTGALVSDGVWFNQFRIDWPAAVGETLIVIPTKNKPDLLRTCIESIERTGDGSSYRIVIVDHQSNEPAARQYLRQLAKRHTVMPYKGTFNYSRINNTAVRQHLGSARFILFLNNDVEAIEDGWLARLASLAARRDVGAVGALLLYADKRVQHAGVILGFNGSADHALKFQDAWLDENGRRNLGYNCALTSVRDYSAVTAACLMMRADVFTAVGGFDEAFGIGFNDTDLCLRIGATGLKILYDGITILYHYESATRSETKQVFHPEDTNRLLEQYSSVLEAGDPYYNPNLSQNTQDHVAREDASCRRDKPPRITTIDLHAELSRPRQPAAKRVRGGALEKTP